MKSGNLQLRSGSFQAPRAKSQDTMLCLCAEQVQWGHFYTTTDAAPNIGGFTPWGIYSYYQLKLTNCFLFLMEHTYMAFPVTLCNTKLSRGLQSCLNLHFKLAMIISVSNLKLPTPISMGSYGLSCHHYGNKSPWQHTPPEDKIKLNSLQDNQFPGGLRYTPLEVCGLVPPPLTDM